MPIFWNLKAVEHMGKLTLEIYTENVKISIWVEYSGIFVHNYLYMYILYGQGWRFLSDRSGINAV